MRICLHTFWDITHDFIGGTERFLVELATELQALGFEPFIVCSGNDTRLTIQGVPVFGVLPDKYLQSFHSLGEAKAAFLKENFVEGKSIESGLHELGAYVQEQVGKFDADVIHLNSFASSLYFESNVPVVVTNHENQQESDRLWGAGFFNRLASMNKESEANLASHAARVVPTRFYAKQYSSLFDADVLGINQGISLTTFNTQIVSNPMMESKSSDTKAIRVLLPSRLDPDQKGHDLAITACKILSDEQFNSEFVFSGIRQDNRHLVSDLRNLCKELGIAEKVSFQRFADINRAFHAADVVISPERYCSYGLSISESLSLGIPTVLSDIPTYKEIASEFSHAFFFESDDAVDLAEKIKEAARYCVSSAEKIRFRTRYDFRECAKRYGDLYLSCVSD